MQATPATPETGSRLLTVREAATRCRVSAPTMYRLIQRGVVPAVRVGSGHTGPIRVREDELERWLYGDPRDAA